MYRLRCGSNNFGDGVGVSFTNFMFFLLVYFFLCFHCIYCVIWAENWCNHRCCIMLHLHQQKNVAFTLLSVCAFSALFLPQIRLERTHVAFVLLWLLPNFDFQFAHKFRVFDLLRASHYEDSIWFVWLVAQSGRHQCDWPFESKRLQTTSKQQSKKEVCVSCFENLWFFYAFKFCIPLNLFFFFFGWNLLIFAAFNFHFSVLVLGTHTLFISH